ncbi:hypothetical protein [Cronobacter muytjensii]|uniref:hypothetical protein n=1 Tax=Cronobacter muytjensii TaxID=413501 RepID=UPI0029FDD39F|nr:hypothetical protein [Cronobacter muytjensii]
MNIVQYKKELLYRKAKGKIIYESYKAKIASLFKMEPGFLNFIDLEATDNILNKSNAFDTRQTKKRLDVKDLSLYLLQLKKVSAHVMYFLMTTGVIVVLFLSLLYRT